MSRTPQIFPFFWKHALSSPSQSSLQKVHHKSQPLARRALEEMWCCRSQASRDVAAWAPAGGKGLPSLPSPRTAWTQFLIECWLQLALLGLQLPAKIAGQHLETGDVGGQGEKRPWNRRNFFKSVLLERLQLWHIISCGTQWGWCNLLPLSWPFCAQGKCHLSGFSVPSHFCINAKDSSETLNRKRQVLPTVLKHFKTSTEMANSIRECGRK